MSGLLVQFVCCGVSWSRFLSQQLSAGPPPGAAGDLNVCWDVGELHVTVTHILVVKLLI